ncbi:hypothetical protein [Runella zeae]|uniref:hypothetical protein n=1 Tax=Runella zeae TaxID=94255 RepID=UPI0023565D5F|nr:hypothetical protein [Runella zeae]
MKIEPYEIAKEFLESLIKRKDSQLVLTAKNSAFLEQCHKIFLESTRKPYHTEWPKVETRVIAWVIDEVLGIVFDIYLFRDRPIDLLEYIKGRLRQYPKESHKALIELINYCLNDPKRFSKKKVDIEYIKQRLTALKTSELEEGIVIDSKQSFSFFGIDSLAVDDFTDAFIYSQGYAMTEKEEIERLRKQYFELTGKDIFNEATPPTTSTETKTDKLKNELGKYGFFELPKVKQLSEPNKQRLIELIGTKPMPYGIAMFDELGFCEHLDNEQGVKYKANTILSRLYNPNAKDDTSAKHYRRSLVKPLQRYKAGEYKETVKTDYQKLK